MAVYPNPKSGGGPCQRAVGARRVRACCTGSVRVLLVIQRAVLGAAIGALAIAYGLVDGHVQPALRAAHHGVHGGGVGSRVCGRRGPDQALDEAVGQPGQEGNDEQAYQ